MKKTELFKTTPYATVKQAYEDHGCILLLSEQEYVNLKSRANYICKCGRLQTGRTISYFMRRNWMCEQCSKENMTKNYNIKHGYGFDDINAAFNNKGLELLTIQDFYKRQETVSYRCLSCGYENQMKIYSIFESPGCRNCLNEKKHIDLWNNWVSLAEQLGVEVLSTIDDYETAKQPIRFKCKCGNEYISCFAEMKHGNKVQCNDCGREKVRGANSYRWKGGTTQERETFRHQAKYQHWRKRIFERDHYTCQCCGYAKGHNLAVHHIYPYSLYPQFDMQDWNGVTLCDSCHNIAVAGSFHYLYGCDVGPAELDEYFDNKRKSLGLKPIKIGDIVGSEIYNKIE